jgi:hypothetical protein
MYRGWKAQRILEISGFQELAPIESPIPPQFHRTMLPLRSLNLKRLGFRGTGQSRREQQDEKKVGEPFPNQVAFQLLDLNEKTWRIHGLRIGIWQWK